MMIRFDLLILQLNTTPIRVFLTKPKKLICQIDIKLTLIFLQLSHRLNRKLTLQVGPVNIGNVVTLNYLLSKTKRRLTLLLNTVFDIRQPGSLTAKPKKLTVPN